MIARADDRIRTANLQLGIGHRHQAIAIGIANNGSAGAGDLEIVATASDNDLSGCHVERSVRSQFSRHRPVSADDQAPHGGGDGGAIRYDEVVVNNGSVANARHAGVSRHAGRDTPIGRGKESALFYATIELINNCPTIWAGRRNGQQHAEACHNNSLHHTLPITFTERRNTAQ